MCCKTVPPRKSIFLNPHGDFFGDVGVANSQFTPKALDGCGLLCFPQTGGDFLQGKKPCGRIVSSLSLDDLCFRLFRHFDAAIFFLKKISPLGTWKNAWFTFTTAQYRRLAFTGHVSCWVSIATRLAHILFLEGDVGRGWRLEG